MVGRLSRTVLAIGVGWAVLGLSAEAKGADEPVATDQPVVGEGVTESGRKIEAPQKLLQEGFRVSDLRGKLVRLPENTRWFLVSDAGEGDEQGGVAEALRVPLEVLPGRYLAAMRDVTGGAVDVSVTFRVWGQITTYRKRNYMLPTSVATLSYFGEVKGEDRKAPKTLADLQKERVTKATEDEGEEVKVDEAGLTEELREALLAIPRTLPLTVRNELEETEGKEKRDGPREGEQEKKAQVATRRRDGDMVIDRVGRLRYDSEERRWLFVFEADGASVAEPPVRLHPSQLLEVMEKKVLATSQLMKFRVSGQITTYRGGEYMLVRKVLMVHDLGNLHR